MSAKIFSGGALMLAVRSTLKASGLVAARARTAPTPTTSTAITTITIVLIIVPSRPWLCFSSWTTFGTRVPDMPGLIFPRALSRCWGMIFPALAPLVLRLQLAQVVVEPIKALLPEAMVIHEPIGRGFQRGSLEPAWPPLRGAPPRDQAGPLQHLEVLGDSGKAHVERLGKLRHRRFTQGEPCQDGPPGGIRQSGECDTQVIARHDLTIWLNSAVDQVLPAAAPVKSRCSSPEPRRT